MAYPNSINANCVQIAEQICATMAAIVQEIMQQVRHSPYTNHTDNQLKDQAHPKSDHKMFIGGYTQDEDYLCVSTDDIWPEYHDNSNCDFDAEAGVDLDVTEEESHQRQLQIGQEDDRVIPEVGDHKELLAKIEDTSLIVTQVCVESTHDKVIPVSHSYFSSPSLSVYAAMGTLCANRKELIIANEVFDKSPPRRGYRVVLNLEPPDDYGSIIHETRDSSLQLGPNAADVETQVVTYCVLVPYATLVPFVTPGLRAKQALKPPVGDSIVPELLLKVLEPYIKKGCILDDERVSLYANVVNKGSTLRIASAEALFWLQLPRALNPLLNKIVSKPLQKSPVLISTYEVDGASMLSKITSKGKSTSGEKNALNFVPFRLLAFEQSGIGTHGELFKINDRNRVYNNIKIASVDWVFKGIHAENFSTVYGNMRKTVSGIPKRNKFAAIMGDIVDLAAELGSYVVQVKQLHLEDKVELEGGNDADDELSLVLWLEQVQGHSYLGLFKMVALLLYFQFGGKGPPTYAVDKENSFQEDINQMTAVSKQVNNHLSYYAYSGDMVLQFLPTNYISAPGAAWAKMTSQVVAAYMMVEALNKKGYNGFALFVPLSNELKHIFTLAALVVIMMMFYSLLEYFTTSMSIQTVVAHQVMNQMIKQVGEDGHGKLIADALEGGGADVDHLSTMTAAPTGHAVVMFQSDGQNSIIIIGGANMSCWSETLPPQDLEVVRNAGIVLLQGKILDSVNIQVAKETKKSGVPVILNAGGVDTPVPPELLNFINIFSSNESELAHLTEMPIEGFEQISQAVVKCHELGVDQVFVKVGAKVSALFTKGEGPIKQPIISAAKVLDSTGAGDTFTAAFALFVIAINQIGLACVQLYAINELAADLFEEAILVGEKYNIGTFIWQNLSDAALEFEIRLVMKCEICIEA